MKRFIEGKRWLLLLISALLCLLVVIQNRGLFDSSHEASINHLDSIRERKILVVSIINSPFTLVNSDYSRGFNVELVHVFAKSMGLEIEMHHANSIEDIRDNSDIIIGLSNPLSSDWIQGPALYTHNLQLVSLNAYEPPQQEKSNSFILSVSQDIKSHDSVQALLTQHPIDERYVLDTRTQNQQFEFSKVIEHPSPNSFISLLNVANRQTDFAIVDSISAALFRRIEPRLKIIANISENEEFAWYFYAPKQDDSLLMAFKAFHETDETVSLLGKLAEKYFNIISSFDKSQTYYFLQAIETKLPEFEPLFKQHAGEFDWRLIAAIAYQESHWDPKAKSPTGVRGMMMLTRDTAEYLGIDDRLDTEKSIIGGIEYLRFLLKRIPSSVDEDDRIWFALAAYNMGIGHLWDARTLTKNHGGNPDKWHDLKRHLPKLRDETVYPKLKYGYARGDEALLYVENIRRFYTTLIGIDGLEYIQAKKVSLESQQMPLENKTATIEDKNAKNHRTLLNKS